MCQKPWLCGLFFCLDQLPCIFCCWFYRLIQQLNGSQLCSFTLIMYMFFRLFYSARCWLCFCVPFKTTHPFELRGNMSGSPDISFEQCVLFLPRFFDYCTFPLNRWTAIFHHFVINSYFLLCKIDLSSTALWLLCWTALLPPETSQGTGKTFHHFVNKETLA